MEETKKSGFSTAGLVLGIIGLCTSFIPIINNVSFVMGVLAIIFAVVAFVKKAAKGKIIASVILGVLAIVITINSQKALADSLETLSNDLNKATGSSTEEVLKNDAKVELGELTVKKGQYGMNDTKLAVKVTNITTKTKSYAIQIEAISSDGSRIMNDYVYANNLNAGQSQNFDAFTYISSDKLEAMKSATFKIVEASAY
ncbi:MAG: DUF4190 domain-containing protein [Clostridia bacterium]|nr:DUF4190 domain-containing protein [Clostridia bacterium]